MDLNERFSKVKVLVIGDCMLDRYWWGHVSRISPEAPVPVVTLSKSTLSAGGAANVAINVAGLGAEAVLLGITGIDEGADLLAGVLERSGIDCQGLIRVEDRPTTLKTRVVAGGQQIARIDQEVHHNLDHEIEDEVIAKIATALDSVDSIVVSDYAKGLLSDNLLRSLIKMAASAGKPVLVDPKGKQYAKYSGATVITPNRREAAEACNFDETEAGMVNRAGARLLADFDFEAVFITQGDAGMTLFRKDREHVHFPASAREVYDVTGAGDTVIATLAASLGAGESLETAGKLANMAAGLVVEQSGTSFVRIAELEKAVGSTL